MLGLTNKSVLDLSWKLATARKTYFWKSSWLRKEIVSHVARFKFKRAYKNKQGYLFWWTFECQGPEQPNSLQSRWQFQTSHIDMSQRWLLLLRTPCLWQKRLVRGQSCSSEVTTALISFSIIDPCPAIRNLHKEMKSRRRAVELCKILYLWRDDRYRSSTNKSWITRDLHSGQIFQLAIKSYLLLTGNDGRKWYVVTIVETAALLLQSCLQNAQVVVNCRKPALRNIKLLVGSEVQIS